MGSQGYKKAYPHMRNSLVILVIVVVALACLARCAPPLAVTVSSNLNGNELPIYCVQTEKKKLSLTFDASWGADQTDKILQILENNQVHATFFITGLWVQHYPGEVKKIYEAGHDIGNHGMNHLDMTKLTDIEIMNEVQDTNTLVKQITGQNMTLFRAPYGAYDNHLILDLEDMGYQCIQWDVDSMDWKDYGTASMIDTVCNHSHLGNGSIILMHNNATYTPEALQQIIDQLQNKGYELVPVSELIYKDHYHMDTEGRQISSQ